MEEIVNEDKQLESSIAGMMGDEMKQKELLVQDEEEDFLDEGAYEIVTSTRVKVVSYTCNLVSYQDNRLKIMKYIYIVSISKTNKTRIELNNKTIRNKCRTDYLHRN